MSGPPPRTTCEALARRNRDRDRCRPLRHAGALLRRPALRDAGRAAAAGRTPSDRAPVPMCLAIPGAPRRDASPSVRRAAGRARVQVQPEALQPRCSELLALAQRSGATSCALTIRVACPPATCRYASGSRSAAGRRRAKMVNERADPRVVHRAVVDRDELVAQHEPELPADAVERCGNVTRCR